MNYLLQFGSYELPDTLRPDDALAATFDVAEQERPRAAGSTSQLARAKSRVLPVKGELTLPVATDLHTLIDTLKQNLAGYGDLYYGRDDRYYRNTQVESLAAQSKDGKTWGKFFAVSLAFRAFDPFQFDAAGIVTSPLASTAGGTVANAGTVDGHPVWTITIGTGGVGTVTLANTTTGETATINAAAGTTFTTGDVIVLTRYGYTVTYNGTPTFSLLSGAIPRLEPGNNTITCTAATVTVSALTCGFIKRYA